MSIPAVRSAGVYERLLDSLPDRKYDRSGVDPGGAVLDPGFDMTVAHRYFAVECFNRAWDLIDKIDRTPEEDEEMIRLCQASLFHWSRRGDRTDQNMSIGYWQASRAYALARRTGEALGYGQLSLDFSQKGGIPPFYVAYAHEALVRAHSVAGNRDKTEAHLSEARRLTEEVSDADSKKMLLDDLATIS